MKPIITEIKRLDQAATKGPWEFGIESGMAMLSTETFAVPGTCDCDIYYENTEGAENLQLIAFYRNNTPALAEAYEKLLEAAEQMKEELQCAYQGSLSYAGAEKALAAFSALKSTE